MPVYQYLNDKHVASAIRNVFKLNKSQQPYFSIYMEQEGGQRLCGHNTGGSEAVWTWHKGGQKLLGHGTGGGQRLCRHGTGESQRLLGHGTGRSQRLRA